MKTIFIDVKTVSAELQALARDLRAKGQTALLVNDDDVIVEIKPRPSLTPEMEAIRKRVAEVTCEEDMTPEERERYYISPLTGAWVVRGRPDQPMITSEDVRKIMEDFP